MPGAQAQVCATPGGAGDVSNVTGVINTYWTPATGTYGTGSTTIALSGQRGAAALLAYGDGAAGEPASGYLSSSPGCAAGRYQFLRAGAGTSGSTLNLAGLPLTAAYEQAAATTTNGRRTLQIIRVPQYANATLGGTVTAPVWDGNSGGVVAIDAALTLNFNGQTIDADGTGFRGAGGRSRDTDDAVERPRWDADTRHGGKGEGIAGTPRFVSEKRSPDDGNTATITDLGATWGGYPTGTASTGDWARGAPGNAGRWQCEFRIDLRGAIDRRYRKRRRRTRTCRKA